MKNYNPHFSQPGNTGYFAYVDEAGDDGFSETSSDWFLLSAFIVEEEDHHAAFDMIDAIKENIHFRNLDDELHFRKLGHEKKKVVIRHLSEAKFLAVSVVVWKKGFSARERQNLSRFPRLYFFMIKCLLERLSWIAREKNTKIEVTFSNRAHVSYGELQHYIFSILRLQDTNHSIDFNFIGPLRIVQNKQRKLLQAADAVVSGFFKGIQPNCYDDVETGYVEKIKSKFWRKDGKLYGYGLKLLPTYQSQEIKKSNEIFSLLFK